MALPSPLPLEHLLQGIELEGRARLEIVHGIGVWEAFPVLRHQSAIDRIRASIRPVVGSPCTCFHMPDVYVRFPDDPGGKPNLRRPDISIWCREPDERDKAVTLLPEAVIEIVSEGYEAKDEQAPAYYLGFGVKDVIVFDPQTGSVVHATKERFLTAKTPYEVVLQCGCGVTV